MIKAVIGANYGDEGKGLMTDYFALKTKKGIVIRYNGGAQASHTVVTPEGFRHAFSHLGSGTFANVPTYLSKHFVTSPMLFRKEVEKLSRKMALPDTWVDERCLVTTPFDILINQIVEDFRGKGRHGSCGMGINETITRHEKHPLYVSTLCDSNLTRQILESIRNNYVWDRLMELGVTCLSVDQIALLVNENIIDAFLDDVQYFLQKVKSVNLYYMYPLTEYFDDIIFEGAQGLLLDQDHANFPHVTRSSTGLKNVMEIMAEGKIAEPVEVTYVTRCYTTRHGVGPFPYECVKEEISDRIIDLTNVPNPYQGTMRFGRLNLYYFYENIKDDFSKFSRKGDTVSVAVTCLDQILHPDSTVDGFNGYNFAEKLYLSYGMTRNTIKEC